MAGDPACIRPGGKGFSELEQEEGQGNACAGGESFEPPLEMAAAEAMRLHWRPDSARPAKTARNGSQTAVPLHLAREGDGETGGRPVAWPHAPAGHERLEKREWGRLRIGPVPPRHSCARADQVCGCADQNFVDTRRGRRKAKLARTSVKSLCRPAGARHADANKAKETSWQDAPLSRTASGERAVPGRSAEPGRWRPLCDCSGAGRRAALRLNAPLCCAGPDGRKHVYLLNFRG